MADAKPLVFSAVQTAPADGEPTQTRFVQSFSLEPDKPSVPPPTPTTTFSATLRDCFEQTTGGFKPSVAGAYGPFPAAPEAAPSIAVSSQAAVSTPAPPKPVNRVWSWAQTRYKLNATKRLRVSETVALGEKRFVAIVSIEGREFLIGGGASGVSLLAHLDSSHATAEHIAEAAL